MNAQVDEKSMNVIVETPADRRPQPVEGSPTDVATPLTLLMRVIQDPNIDLVRLEKLMELEARWRAVQNEQAYVRAFAQFKSNMPEVICDMVNKQYDSDYSSLANLVNTTNKVLGQYGLNARWDIDQTNGIKITCIMTHEAGHKEKVVITGPLDTSGQKNPLQQIKSTLTYLEGATFQAITGVVARAASTDDDGNSSGLRDKTPRPKAAAPDGYETWKMDLKAASDNGTAALRSVWEDAIAKEGEPARPSKKKFRLYMNANEPNLWKDYRATAEAVDAKLKAEGTQ